MKYSNKSQDIKNLTEKYITNYKIVLFYPGRYKGDFELFGLLDDKNPYRTIKLINENYLAKVQNKLEITPLGKASFKNVLKKLNLKKILKM